MIPGTSSAPIDAVVLAGGRIDGEFARAAATEYKAAVQLGETPQTTLLARCLRALRESRLVGQIAVVGPAEIFSLLEDVHRILPVAETPDAIGNVTAGIQALRNAGLPQGERILLAASDLPFVTPQDIRQLIELAPVGAEIAFPITSRNIFEAAFPDFPRVWTPISGYECTGGSILLVRPDALLRNRGLVDRVFAARKSQIQMAMLLGLPFVIRFKLGKLTVDEAEKRVSELTGCRCVAIRDAAPGLALDIDDAAEYQRVREKFRSWQEGME